MSGFLLLAGAYVALWSLLLAPGAVLLMRKRQPSPGVDDGLDDGWAASLHAQMRRDAPPPVDAVPTRPVVAASRRLRRRSPARPSEGVIHVNGSLVIGEAREVPAGLVVEGDLTCRPRSVVAGSVCASGSIHLEQGARCAASLVAARDVTLDADTCVDGSVEAGRLAALGDGTLVHGQVSARRLIVLAVGASAGSCNAPSVQGAPADLPADIPGRSSQRPLPPARWTRTMDAVLNDEWPHGRLAEITDRIRSRTGADVRGVHVLARARQLRLLGAGLPSRPALVGRKPAWLLDPETVRVGADLNVPAGDTVSYRLVVEGALEVFEGATLEAPVRAGRGVLLHPGSVVHGQVVSDAMVVCAHGSAVLGPVDTSANLLVMANARVGTPGFGGAHALGWIEVEPGAEIVGGAIAGTGVRGSAPHASMPGQRA